MKKTIILLVSLFSVIFIGYRYGLIALDNKNLYKQELKTEEQKILPQEENNQKTADVDNKRILIEFSGSNWAWAFFYKGTVVCNDGTIYSFNFSGDRTIANLLSQDPALRELNEIILNRATQSSEKMSETDLQELKNYLKGIKATYKEQSVANDEGQSSIKFYDFEKNEKIIIKSCGDRNITNKSKNINKILKILQKYSLTPVCLKYESGL
ncbi:MAG: hypothetical protein LBL61_01060 [Elusimicrobiota bacterium]|jgi:hypothetical protein|nr:hypothetical protein [Elusimicrobiota bacterium]